MDLMDSIGPPPPATFSVWDYVVFVLFLSVSASIGVYHACAGGKQQSTREFVMANRSMSAIPIALSTLASFFSASTLLGTPAEIYLRGTMYWLAAWGAMVAPCLGAYLFGPLFHKMGVVSVFEYLEKRFKSKAVRCFGALLFVIRASLGMGIVVFGPAVALEEVTNIPVPFTICLIGVVGAFYTALGGLKAVIWSDVFQIGIMVAGMLAALIKGSLVVGSLSEVWKIADDGDRIEFWDFDPNPTTRHTFWTLVIGNIFVWLPPYTVDQQMIQRFASTKTLRQAVVALLLNAPGMFFIITLCSLTGVVMYAYYAECDPIKAEIVTDPNQLMPRFVMDLFVDAPGVPGLFVAALFSAALSSVSSMLSSLAAVTWEDFFKQCACSREKTDQQATVANKILAVCYAVLGVGMGFVFSQVGGTVLQMSLAFNGAAGAPLVGIFILGVFVPWANAIGTIVGGVLGFCFPMWISIGAYVTDPDVLENLPTSTDGCPWMNDSMATTPALSPMTTGQPPDLTGLEKLYTLSYLWYTPVGILVTVIVGVIVSFITGATDPDTIDKRLLLSYVDKFWCCFPEGCKRRVRCGIDYSKTDDVSDDAGGADASPLNDKISADRDVTSDQSARPPSSSTDPPKYNEIWPCLGDCINERTFVTKL